MTTRSALTTCCCLVLAVLATPDVQAVQFYVDASNTSGIEDGTQANPFTVIQVAIDIASSGDEVLVAAGTYFETIRMANGVDVLGEDARTTIIDGTGLQNSIVTFDATRENPILSGFTLTGGKGDRIGTFNDIPIFAGGGVLILDSSPLVVRNIITGNVIDEGITRGGGIYVSVRASTPEIRDNVIRDNTSLSLTEPGEGQGGGIYVVTKGGGAIVEGNLIEQNQALDGGGLCIENTAAGTVDVQRNTVRENVAEKGAGIWLAEFDSVCSIVNNLIVANTATGTSPSGGAVHAEVFGTGAASVRNNTLVDNTAIGGTGGAVFLDDTSATTTLTLVANNVMADNSADNGGGIDHTAFSGTIQRNDLHLNVGGDLYDAGGSTATLLDNLFLDPMFLGVGDYRPMDISPLVDTAEATAAPTDDHELFARPFDGPDGDAIAQSDIGAWEYPAGDVPTPIFPTDDSLTWQVLTLQNSFNVYRGSLTSLLAGGDHTQDPMTEPLAARTCGLPAAGLPLIDSDIPPLGEAMFYLVTQTIGSYESGLGAESTGLTRLNTLPCP